MTLYALCFQPSPLTVGDVIAEVEKSAVPVYCTTAVPALQVYDCLCSFSAAFEILKGFLILLGTTPVFL